MTVAQVIEELSKFDPNIELLIVGDDGDLFPASVFKYQENIGAYLEKEHSWEPTTYSRALVIE